MTEENRRIAIVTTTINDRPESYAEWAQQGRLIVAGDVTTPAATKSFVEELGGFYLPVEEQEAESFAPWIPRRCIQRRNFAVFEAYRQNFDYVMTIDDDNFPSSPTMIEEMIEIMESNAMHTPGVMGEWINTGDFVDPPTWQRGTPYGVDTSYRLTGRSNPWSQIAVVQAQITGAPDADAITHMLDQPEVKSCRTDVVIEGGWFAFNSQATLWRGIFSPLIACLPHVGRYDDIYASFIAQWVMFPYNSRVYVGNPTARQERNPHDYVEDLRRERDGLKNTVAVTKALESIKAEERNIVTRYTLAANALQDLLPSDTLLFMFAWAKAWWAIEKTRERPR